MQNKIAADPIRWPDDVPLPPLPESYTWIALVPALGIDLPSGEHPWIVRVQWRDSRDVRKTRIISPVTEFFEDMTTAINEGVRVAHTHASRPLHMKIFGPNRL